MTFGLATFVQDIGGSSDVTQEGLSAHHDVGALAQAAATIAALDL